MKFQGKVKSFGRSLGRHTLLTLRWIISRLPYSVYRVGAYIFFFIGHCVMINKRKIAQQNLAIALSKEKSEEEIQKIAHDCFNNFGWGMIDLIYLIDRPKMITQKVRIDGKNHLDQALQAGNGAILISAHFGNFILMYLKMVLEGYKTNVIMKRTRDEAFERDLSEFRNERGIKTIYDLPSRGCVQKCLKALRNNEILFILMDQNYGGAGRVFVDFFGEKAATATGPVVFSNRTKAPILPIFMRHGQKDQHLLVIEPPVILEQFEDEEKMMKVNIGKMSKIIESYIRQYPHEWGGWMHKRWKSIPVEQQRVIDRINEERRKRKEPLISRYK